MALFLVAVLVRGAFSSSFRRRRFPRRGLRSCRLLRGHVSSLSCIRGSCLPGSQRDRREQDSQLPRFAEGHPAIFGKNPQENGFAREAFDAAGGWPLTKRGDFDQTFLQRLAGAATAVDPCRAYPPSYVFRWGSTHAYHGQGLMHGPSDVEWYERATELYPVGATDAIKPGLDAESAWVFDRAPRDSDDLLI